MFYESMKDVIDAVKERYRSPFIGSFVVSWLIWNWKIPYFSLFVSEEFITPFNKLDYVKILVYHTEYKFWNFVLGPFLVTLFLALGYPYFKGWIEYFKNVVELFFRRKDEKHSSDYPLMIDRNKYLEEVTKLATVDIKNKIRKGEITPEELFTGRWEVLLFKAFTKERELWFRDGKFYKSNSSNAEYLWIGAFYSLDPHNSSGSIGTEVQLLPNEQHFKATVDIFNRSKVRLYLQESGETIELSQTSIGDNFVWESK